MVIEYWLKTTDFNDGLRHLLVSVFLYVIVHSDGCLINFPLHNWVTFQASYGPVGLGCCIKLRCLEGLDFIRPGWDVLKCSVWVQGCCALLA